MRPNATKKDKLDLESVEEMKKSRAWRMVDARIRLMIRRRMDDLCKDLPEKDSAMLRGGIKALTEVLEIPAILANEARKDVAEIRAMEE